MNAERSHGMNAERSHGMNGERSHGMNAERSRRPSRTGHLRFKPVSRTPLQ